MPLKKTGTKSAQPEKHGRTNTAIAKVSKGSAVTGSTMKMTIATTPTMTPRLHHRKVLRLAGKRPGAHHHRSLALGSGKGRPALRPTVDATCDNSDDSGLGFDHHMDVRPIQFAERNVWNDEVPEIKRRKLELKVENEETNDGYCFPETLKNCKENNSIIRALPNSGIQNLGRNTTQNVNSTKNIARCLPLVTRRAPVTGPVTLTTQLTSASRNGKVHLQIICQPEQQHRARYQTEGSRGAVKDRTGNGFPIVKLIGYDKPATLQIFIGTDLGRVAPHMFYQACRVSGKNSTPCIEKKIDGTIVIEVELEPTKEMIATCDCVGILKERNVDVEHRFPEQLSSRSKKKSTKCRMVFRTTITNDDGTTETLQVCSQPIVCTQPPGIPEICKKSLTTCPASGGLELFILGKNFLKDTRVVFQQQAVYDSGDRAEVLWEEMVAPDKEFLQQTHLVCVVPPYVRQDIQDPVSVRLFVISSGKNSEAHTFLYTPVTTNVAPSATAATVRLEANPPSAAPFLSKMLWQTGTPKQEMDLGMMPPPTSLVPLTQRRPSTNMTMVDCNSPPMRSLKTELMDENSQGSVINENSMDMRHRFRALSESSMDVHDDTNMTMINENSIDLLRRQEIIKNQIDVINENSNSVASFHCDKSNHSIHNDESMDNSSPTETRIFAQNNLLTAHNLIQPNIENTALSADDLKGVDLRMKTPLATLNDLANTQPPSLATLRRFVVTEPTNMPLPAQTGQSVENYLTTLENNIIKSVVSDSLANSTLKTENEQLMVLSIKNNSLLEGAPILSSQFAPSTQPATLGNMSQLLTTDNTVPGTKTLFTNEHALTNTLLTTSANAEILSNLNESHIASQNLMAPEQVIFSGQPASALLETPQTEVLKTETNLILSQQNLQVALNVNSMQNLAATPKLDALVNSTVETHIGSPNQSPQQDLLIGNKSPLLPSSPQEILRRSPLIVAQQSEILISHTPSPEVLLNPQAPLLSSTIAPNELIIHSPSNDIVSAHVSPNALSPEVILNPQVAPTVMCNPLNTICPQSVLQNSPMQTEILSAETAANSALLSTLKSPPVSVESIVMNAAVDYLETQKKISEITRMDNHLMQTSADQQKTAQEQNLINSLLDVRSNPPTQEAFANNQARVLLQNQTMTDLLKLSQTQFVTGSNSQDILNTISSADKPALNTNEYLTQVNLDLQVSKQQESNKSELTLVKQITEQSVTSAPPQSSELKKNEEGMIPPALTNMSENDLISYINPSCFDQGTFTS